MLDKPDVVVVMHVTNDIGVLDGDNEYRSRMGQRPSWRDFADWFSQVVSSRVYVVAALRHALADSAMKPKHPGAEMAKRSGRGRQGPYRPV